MASCVPFNIFATAALFVVFRLHGFGACSYFFSSFLEGCRNCELIIATEVNRYLTVRCGLGGGGGVFLFGLARDGPAYSVSDSLKC